MADNYLERRMEELRSGRLTVKGCVPGIRPGSLRVLAVGGTKGEALEKVMEYRKKGYRVAVFDSDEKEGKRMAYENGIRFHRVDLVDDDAIAKETNALLQAWRGIDIVVSEERISSIIAQQISQWRKSMPIPDLSSPEIVILKQKEDSFMDKEHHSRSAINHEERMKMIEELSGSIDPSMIDLTDERTRYILKLDKN